MQAYRSGDEEAFRSLYDRYAPRLFGFLVRRTSSREVAADLFQTVLLKLHESRRSYDASFPFAPWLFAITRNALTDHFRKEARLPAGASLEELPIVAASADATEVSLDVLPEIQQETLRLRYGSDLSFEEISKRLSKSPSNVRQILSRAIRKLREER